ncbi:hypothetical protein [Celeribacter sp.]|uniref:hypothetical protein n=1 Tax=Celeribacter sp. TaxID=1890673 RepID=UPI003A93434C
MDFDLAMTALEKAAPHLSDEEHDALGGFVAMFEPYQGDPADEARTREGVTGFCPNCAYEQAAMFFPARLEKTAMAAARHSQCPRCFCTEMMMAPPQV